LLSASLSPCRRCYPAEVGRHLSQRVPIPMLPSPQFHRLGLRGCVLSRLHLRSLALRPGDSLATLTWLLSIGFRSSISLRLLSELQGSWLLPWRD